MVLWLVGFWLVGFVGFGLVFLFVMDEKAAFKEMMIKVAHKDMVAVRMDILEQTFDIVDIYEYE